MPPSFNLSKKTRTSVMKYSKMNKTILKNMLRSEDGEWNLRTFHCRSTYFTTARATDNSVAAILANNQVNI